MDARMQEISGTVDECLTSLFKIHYFFEVATTKARRDKLRVHIKEAVEVFKKFVAEAIRVSKVRSAAPTLSAPPFDGRAATGMHVPAPTTPPATTRRVPMSIVTHRHGDETCEVSSKQLA